MPEPQKERFVDFPGDSIDMASALSRRIVETRMDREGRQGRLILVESRNVRRKLRRYASARESLTEADALFVAIAYLPHVDAASHITSGAVQPDPLHKARLVRTLGIREEAERWAIIQAARLLAFVDETAREFGGSCDWVLEGVDWDRIAEILAVPAGHRICGMIAISGPGMKLLPESLANQEGIPIDLNGFCGGFVRSEGDSGEAPGRAL
ncbi:hypothetical protein GC170_15955 [bacterium]|nr:hypothetical protein [bacterium]